MHCLIANNKYKMALVGSSWRMSANKGAGRSFCHVFPCLLELSSAGQEVDPRPEVVVDHLLQLVQAPRGESLGLVCRLGPPQVWFTPSSLL